MKLKFLVFWAGLFMSSWVMGFDPAYYYRVNMIPVALKDGKYMILLDEKDSGKYGSVKGHQAEQDLINLKKNVANKLNDDLGYNFIAHEIINQPAAEEFKIKNTFVNSEAKQEVIGGSPADVQNRFYYFFTEYKAPKDKYSKWFEFPFDEVAKSQIVDFATLERHLTEAIQKKLSDLSHLPSVTQTPAPVSVPTPTITSVVTAAPAITNLQDALIKLQVSLNTLAMNLKR